MVRLLSDGRVLYSDHLQTEVSSDHIFVRTKVTPYQTISRFDLWSDNPRRKWSLIRPKWDHCPHSFPLVAIPRHWNFSPETCLVRSTWAWSEVTSVWHLDLGRNHIDCSFIFPKRSSGNSNFYSLSSTRNVVICSSFSKSSRYMVSVVRTCYVFQSFDHGDTFCMLLISFTPA